MPSTAEHFTSVNKGFATEKMRVSFLSEDINAY